MKRILLSGVIFLVVISLSSCSLLTKKAEAPAKTKVEAPVKIKTSFRMKVNSTSIFVNGKEFIMDVPVREIDGRTLVPLKFIADFLGAQDTKYDPLTEEITFSLER